MAEVITVRGLRELQAAMRALPKRLDRRILNAALMAGARPMVKAAKAKVPVDTAALKSGIRATPVRPKQHTATVHVGIGRARQSKAERAKGAKKYTPWYGFLVEFGTSKMSARPFLRPAFETTKQAAVEIIKAAIGRRIEIEAAKLKR